MSLQHKSQQNAALINRTQSLDSFRTTFSVPYSMQRANTYSQHSSFSDDVLVHGRNAGMQTHDAVPPMNAPNPQTPPVYESNSEAAEMSPLTILSTTAEQRYSNEPTQYTTPDQGSRPENLAQPRPLDMSAQVIRTQQLPQSPCSAGPLQTRHVQDVYYQRAPQTLTEPIYHQSMERIEQPIAQYEPVSIGTCSTNAEPMQMMVSPPPMQVQAPFHQSVPAQQQHAWYDPAPNHGPLMVVPQPQFNLPSALTGYDLNSFSAFQDFGIKTEQDATLMLPSARAAFLY